MAAGRSGLVRCLWAWAALAFMPFSVWAASWQILVVGLRDDPRYERKTLEQAFIGKPTGRPLVAAQIAIDEIKDNLQDGGNQLKLQDLQWDGKSTTELLAEINKRKAQVLLLDLPVEQQKALMEAPCVAPPATPTGCTPCPASACSPTRWPNGWPRAIGAT